MRTPDITTIETSTLGNRSYLVTLGGHAFVVDPQRDLDRMTELLDGLSLTHVVETHIHNDYVTGGLALARATGADYVLNAEDAVAFDRVGVTDGQQLDLGPMTLRVVATPGHTPSHLAYVLMVDGEEVAVFSGGSMLFGTTGRTDLIDPRMTEDLTRRQYASVRSLAHDLAPTVQVLPTHGFGSFCSAGGSGEDTDESTIGDQRRSNSAVTTPDVETFVRDTIEGLGAYPRYYREMGPINASGPDAPDLEMPTSLSSAAVDDALAADTWVVDVRPRRSFAAGHRKGAVNVEADGQMATYLGWILPTVKTPLALMAEEQDKVALAVRELSRIGADEVVGAWVGEDAGERTYRVATFDDLRGKPADQGAAVVLDVRRDEEVAEGAISGSIHIPLPDLKDRVGEIPAGVVWVHCASGFRASIAASLLDGAGREVVLIDDEFEEEDAKIEVT